MRLLRKKTEAAIIDALVNAVDTTQRATKLVADKDREIARLQAELGVQQAVRDYLALSKYVH